MELTPIRIPGKRRRKGAPPIVFDVAGASRRHRHHGKDHSTTRSRSSQTNTSKDKRQKKRQRVAKKPRASYLERELPLEIVERIFWMSENVNFARSGPRVGQLLSSPSTRRETFLRAFGPTWEVWFGVVRTSRDRVASYHGWREDSARFGGNPEFQVSSIACLSHEPVSGFSLSHKTNGISCSPPFWNTLGLTYPLS